MKRGKGRPYKELDKAIFEQLCAMMCTKWEIADFFSCDEDTVNNWCKRIYGKTFSEVWKEKNARGRISVRRAQYKAGVEEGNITMLIWLGKQYLEQTEKQEVHSENNNYNLIDFTNMSTEEIKKILDKK